MAFVKFRKTVNKNLLRAFQYNLSVSTLYAVIPLWYIHIKSGSMYNFWNPQRYIILGQLTHAIHDIINTTSFHSREIIYA